MVRSSSTPVRSPLPTMRRTVHREWLLALVLVFSFHFLTPDSQRPKLSIPTEPLPQVVVDSPSDSNPDADPDPVRYAHASLAFLESRKKVYEEAGQAQNWHLRGIAHLYEHHRVLLVGQHVVVSSKGGGGAGLHSIRIDNVYSHFHGDNNKPQPACELLSLWVRVRGPEIFAGKARPVEGGGSDDCWWTFDFRPTVAGNYKVESKVLVWAGATSQTQPQTCKHPTTLNTPVPPHILQRYQRIPFLGFKLYKPNPTCGRACTQQVDPPCRYWSAPQWLLPNSTAFWRGCDLYFDRSVSMDEMPFVSNYLGNLTRPTKKRARLRSHLQRSEGVEAFWHGPPCLNQSFGADYFVGCGWHSAFALDFPCLSGELDDKVYLVQEAFSVAAVDDGSDAATPTVLKPLCSLDAESRESVDLPVGRWIPEAWPSASECPFPFRQESKMTKITVHDGLRPHCWHRDNLFAKSMCIEGEARAIPDSAQFRSDFMETKWMGFWRRYDCDYLEFTDAQLQQCIDRLRVKEFNRAGVSVSRMTLEYVMHRLRNITLYRGADSGRTVTFDTLGITHYTHLSSEGFLQNLTRSHPGQSNQDDFYFIVSPTFITGERAFRSHMERMKYYASVIKEHMGLVREDDHGNLTMNKGYRYLNVFDMSAAMMYEVSVQQDGLHPTGPVSKMIVTKIFHHLCKGVVNGTRL